MEIAVVGVGAIGGVCAANLIAAGRSVTCCARTRFTELRLEAPERTLRFAPRIETDPARVAAAAFVLLATKAHETEGAAGWLAALVGPETPVAVLQNGVEHVQRLSRWVPREWIVPVVVACPATAIAPGHVRQRRRALLTVPDDAGGRAFAALFAGTAVAVEATADWPTAAWRKLCGNVTGGALAALAGAPLDQAAHPRMRELAFALARECAMVARAEGADVPPSFAVQVANETMSAAPGGAPSTLTDRRCGRALEVDARNGAVVRLGARHGIATPVNARAAELMRSAHTMPDVDLLPALASALP